MSSLRKIITYFLTLYLTETAVRGIWAKRACRSLQLLNYDAGVSPPFQLQEETLQHIQSLASPVTVISAIGNARLGKSTALNCIHYAWWDQSDTCENVFKTGDTQTPETRGVWIKILQGKGQNDGNVILLDVEGTNAGDRSVIDNLSIFTGLLSSEIMTFTGKYVENHILDFFYRIVKLLDMVTEYKQIASLPNLRVVQIGALRTPGKTQRQFVADALTSPFYTDGYNELRKAIRKYFPGEKIQATELVHLQANNLDILEDFPQNQDSLYAKQIRNLVKELQGVSPKRTLGGSLLDGKTFVDMAVKLVAAMNSNFWADFGDQYKGIERELCDKAAKRFLNDLNDKPVLEIEQMIDERVKKFEDECALQEERDAKKKEVGTMLMGKKEVQDLIKKRKAADLEKDEAIKKQQKILEEIKRKEREYSERLAKVELEKKDAVKERERIERERQKDREAFDRRIKEMEKILSQPRQRGSGIGEFLVGVGAVLGGIAAFSDVRLKKSLTVSDHSRYGSLGVQSYEWQWNEKANNLGLFGYEKGVIAQEVEKLHPRVVTVGKYGYKEVDYGMLDILLIYGNSNNTNFSHTLSSKVQECGMAN